MEEDTSKPKTPLEECDYAIRRLKAQADKGQLLAWGASTVIVLSGAAIPVCIVISTQTSAFVLGQLVPAVLAALSAAVAGGTQIARPNERWRYNRKNEMVLRNERFSYVHQLGTYSGDDRDRVFLERVNARNRSALDEWGAYVHPAAADPDQDNPKDPRV